MKYYALGDSITAGAGASMDGLGYIALLNSALGVAFKNAAVSSYMAMDAMIEALKTRDAPAGSNFVLMFGVNDQAKYDTDPEKLGYFIDCMRAYAIQGSAETVAAASSTDIQYNGNWQKRDLSRYSSTVDDSATWKISGDVLYLCLQRELGNQGSFSIFIDGIEKGQFLNGGDIRTLLANPAKVGPMCLAFENLGAGSHTVELKVVGGSGPTSLLWYSTGKPKSKVCIANIPHAAHYSYGGSDDNVDTYNAALETLVKDLKNQGLDVEYADVCSALNKTDIADNVHPNDSGHQKISQVVFRALTGKSPPPSIKAELALDEAGVLIHPVYRADVDGLRALAVLSVIGFHAFPEWVRGGFVGVDVFFVISGFLISSIIFGSLQRSGFSFLEFYSRRIRRIFPALLLVLVACLVAGWYVLLGSEFAQLGKHTTGGAFFLSNILLKREVGYFDAAADTKQLLHLWSLGIEEQFYIVWPAVLWLAWRKRLNLLTVSIVLAMVSYLINVRVVANNVPAAFYFPQSRFWELLIGATLAYVSLCKAEIYERVNIKIDALLGVVVYAKAPVNEGGTLRNLQSVCGAFMIGVGVFLIRKDMPFPGYVALLPTLGALLLIAAGPNGWVNRKILAKPFLVLVGLISFPLYLWHWPLLSFLRILQEGVPSVWMRFSAVALAFVLAWATYKFVEQPIRNAKKHKRVITFVLIAAMVSVGIAGAVIYKLDGMRSRFESMEKLAAFFDNYPHMPYHNDNCDAHFPMFKSFIGCISSKPGGPEVLVVGDSHAQHYYRGLAKALPDKTVMNLTEFSCLPFASGDHLAANNCAEKLSLATRVISSEQSLKTVYLGGHWAYLMSGGFGKTGPSWRLARDLTKDQVDSFKQNGRVFLKAMVATGKEIVLIKDNPDFAFSINSCFKFRPVSFSKEPRSPCAMDRSEFDHRIKPYDDVLNELLAEFPEVKVFDPRPIFCDGKLCSAILDGTLLFFNADHLTLAGADLVLKNLLAEYPSN